jgi:putative SOS response-associated peptidase YedK
MQKIHNTKQRMPIILKKEDETSWLQGENYNDFAYPYSCKLIAANLETGPVGQFGLFD